MKHLYIAILTLLFVMLSPAYAQESIEPLWIQVIHPQNRSTINAYSTFFVGNTTPDASLKINNMPVKVYENGGFVHVVELNPGDNIVELSTRIGNYSKKIKYLIKVPQYEITIPEFPMKIEESSLTPSDAILYKAGDTINVSFKGSTGHKAYFSIGRKRKNIPMQEQPPKYVKTKPVFGKAQNTSYIPIKGFYKGSYKIGPNDDFNNELITVNLVSDKERLSISSKSTISTIPNTAYPIIASIIKNNAIIRTAPDKSRLTPLPEGTLLNITGRVGSNYRFKLGENMDGWVAADDIILMPKGTPAPESNINIIDIIDNQEYIDIKVPLASKLPFIIEQSAENKMQMKIFGTKADIDMFSYDNKSKFIKEIKWNQETNDTVSITIRTKTKQFWGYKYSYDGDTLILSLRKPPVIDADQPLKDKIICIDPGHGGKEEGAKGPTGIAEKHINLKIAKELEAALLEKGAKVIMTRDIDEEVDLYDRVKYAVDNNAHIILSLHNNSLPDGRNPYIDHGTSTYYYHSQSLPLARFMHKAMLNEAGFKDFGIFWSSFVLTRPHEALSVLLEVGFMINPEEYNTLIKSKFQTKIAESITRGLEYFFISNIEKPAEDTAH